MAALLVEYPHSMLPRENRSAQRPRNGVFHFVVSCFLTEPKGIHHLPVQKRI
jgi:hypothetical protein